MNMNELVRLIKKRQADKLYISQPFGSALHYRRKELKMTLEEASEDICCISYLSKVENNMILASEEFIDKFKKKLNLVDAYDYDLETYRIHLNLIISACLKEEELDQQMIKYYEGRMDYQSILANYAYYVLKKEFGKAEALYHHVVSLVPSMPHESFIMSMILLNYSLHHKMRYSDGLHILNLIEKQQPYPKEITLIIKKLKLMHAFKLNNHFLIQKLYQRYADELIEKQLFHQLKKISIKKLIYESRVCPIEDMREELSKISNIEEQEKEFIISRCHYFKGTYEKALYISTKYFKNSEEWLLLHLLNLDRLNMKEKIMFIINNEQSSIDPRYVLLKRHLFYKYTKNQEEIIGYIKREILTQAFITDDQEILTYFMKDCERLLSNFQYYKDAVLIYRSFTRRINNITYV